MKLKKTLQWIAIVIIALVALRFGTAAIWPIINDVKTGATPEYPDLQAQHFKTDPNKVFDAALAVARATGWEVVTANAVPPATSKTREIRAVATTPAAPTLYTDADLRGPLAVVMGSEQYGLSDFWLREADLPVRIPMAGQADSLNVAMATIITLFEAVRQRGR